VWRVSARLDDHQRVAVGVAEPEERRDGVAEAADLGVDVHAAVLELRVLGVDVVGLQRDAGVLAAGATPGPGGQIAIGVSAPGGATSIQRSPSPKGTSTRFSRPSVSV
jgi:hypothetical protein